MCYSRRKSTQFCNIYIANIGLFTKLSQWHNNSTPLQQTITRPAGTTRPTLQTT